MNGCDCVQLPALVSLNKKVASLNMIHSYGVVTIKIVSSESNPWYCLMYTT